jgi:segregation and condensation protein B
MSLKAKVEAIIYATEEPVTLNELAVLLKDPVLAELRAEEEARLALNETVSDGVAEVAEDADDTVEALPIEEEREAPVVSENADSAASPVTSTETQPAVDSKEARQAQAKEELKTAKARLSLIIDELIADYASGERGMEIRQIAGGYRMATKPEHHDVVVSFAKSLKPPVRLSLQALETLAVIAYKQPVTVPEISEIRGVDSAGVIATLFDRKLVTTAGRKQVIGRPILYKTTKEFLMRFGLKDLAELPSMEEFEKLGDPQTDLFAGAANASPAVTNGAAEESVTEAVPEAGSHLMGETESPADGTRATEAEVVAPDAAEWQPDTPVAEEAFSEEAEPVTEAVPETVIHHNLVGESTMPAEGSYATEAEAGDTSEKS